MSDTVQPIGWKCPVCNRINSPFVTQCPSCVPAVPSKKPWDGYITPFEYKKPWPNYPEPYIGDPLPDQLPTTTCATL